MRVMTKRVEYLIGARIRDRKKMVLSGAGHVLHPRVRLSSETSRRGVKHFLLSVITTSPGDRLRESSKQVRPLMETDQTGQRCPVVHEWFLVLC